jgi:hypothetical protein
METGFIDWLIIAARSDGWAARNSPNVVDRFALTW